MNTQMEASFLSMELFEPNEIVETQESNLKNCAVFDYRSLDYSELASFLSENPEAFETINVDPNYKIENVAYSQYNDKNYWDLLMLLNSRNMIEDMPKNQDLLVEEVNEIADSYFKNYQGNTPEHETGEYDENNQAIKKTIKDAYIEYLLEKKTQENYEKQKFYALKSGYKKQFLRTVKYKI